MNVLQRLEKAEQLAKRVAARKVGPARLRKLTPDDALMTLLEVDHNGDIERLTEAALWALVEQASLSERMKLETQTYES